MLSMKLGNVALVPIAAWYVAPHADGLPAVEKSAVCGHVVCWLQLKKLCTCQRQLASSSPMV